MNLNASSNSQLIHLLREGYVQGLADDLNLELEKRALNDDEKLLINLKLDQKFKEAINRQNEHLTNREKIFILLSSILLLYLYPLFIIYSGILKSKGYCAKHKEFWKYILYGWSLYILLLLSWVLLFYRTSLFN